MKVYVVVSLGCIECGDLNEKPVVGVFASKEAARVAVAELAADAEENRQENIRRGYPSRPVEIEAHGGFSRSQWQVRLAEVEVA